MPADRHKNWAADHDSRVLALERRTSVCLPSLLCGPIHRVFSIGECRPATCRGFRYKRPALARVGGRQRAVDYSLPGRATENLRELATVVSGRRPHLKLAPEFFAVFFQSDSH
jgi:hypothetical protein